MARRSYKRGPGVNLGTRKGPVWEGIGKALGGLPEIVTFETITVGDRNGEQFHKTASNELIHVQQGKARIEFQDRAFLVEPRDTFIIPRGVEHRDVRQSEGPYLTFYVFFHWEAGEDFLREIDPRVLLQMPDASKGLLHHLMTEFESEYLSKEDASTERLGIMLLEVLLALLRHSRPAGKKVSKATSRAAEQQRRTVVEEAKRYLDEHYADPVGLDELARMLDVSPFHLSRCFSQEFGTSISDTLTAIRIERAKELLRDSRLSVKQIASETGYSAGNYFSKVFRRATGLSPNEYRSLERGSRRR